MAVVVGVVGTGVVVTGVGEETGVVVDTQMLKCFSTVPLGPQISQKQKEPSWVKLRIFPGGRGAAVSHRDPEPWARPKRGRRASPSSCQW